MSDSGPGHNDGSTSERGRQTDSGSGAELPTSDDVSVREAQNELTDIMRRDVPFEQKARQALELGRQFVGADNGHLTRIDTTTDHWEAVVSTDPSGGRFPPGLELDLDTTYCRRTLASDGPVTLSDALSQGWEDDPAVQTHGLYCYHGTTVYVDGDRYGTVCFVADDSREEPFAEGETMLAELITQMLGRELERNQHEAELTRKANLVNVLNRVLRHNLRNDLSIVRGRARLLMEQSEEEAHGEECLRAVDELLELSQKARRLERVVGEDLERQQTDIVALVERVVDGIADDFPDVSFSVEHDGNVTAVVGGSFERAVEELVENAAKHGGETPTVRITVEAVPNAAEVRITDDGPGLDETEQQVLATGAETPLIHGSGLGLWLAYWIVSEHDGEIETDTSDDGTTMTLSVPRSPGVETQHRVAELREARDRYQAAFEGAFDGMVIFGDDARIVAANPAAAAICDLGRSDLLGRSLEEFLPEAIDFEERWEALKQAGTERDVVTCVTADGADRPVEYSATTDIVPGQHLLVLRDVSERIERERALERRRDMLGYTEQVANVGAVEVTPAEETVRWTDGARTIHGVGDDYDPDVENALDFFVPDDREAVQQKFEQCLETGDSYHGEYRIETADGDRRWVDFYAEPVESDHGTTLVRGALQDTTEQKQRERRLQQERQRFERLLEASPVGITVLDGSGAFVRANERAEEVLGLNDAEITDRHYDDPEWEIVNAAGDPIPSENLPFRRVLETGSPVYEFEHGVRLPDGGRRWLSVNAAPLTTSEGDAERVIAIITDRTDRHDGPA